MIFIALFADSEFFGTAGALEVNGKIFAAIFAVPIVIFVFGTPEDGHLAVT